LQEFGWDKPSSPPVLPQSFAYDLYNNYIWGFDAIQVR
jgi:hypothetical protein